MREQIPSRHLRYSDETANHGSRGGQSLGDHKAVGFGLKFALVA